MSERTYEVRIDVTASELVTLKHAIKNWNLDISAVNDILNRIIIAHAEQNLSAEKEEEIKAVLVVEK